jgi:hypothetical protein
MSACIFCGDHAGTSIRIPCYYLSDFRSLETETDLSVDIPACTECKEALDEVSYQSIEGAARYLSSVYRDRYDHLLSNCNWNKQELEELGHNLRSSIEISLRNQLDIKARLEQCDRVGSLGPTISDELYEEIVYHLSDQMNSSEKQLSPSNDVSHPRNPASAAGAAKAKPTRDAPDNGKPSITDCEIDLEPEEAPERYFDRTKHNLASGVFFPVGSPSTLSTGVDIELDVASDSAQITGDGISSEIVDDPPAGQELTCNNINGTAEAEGQPTSPRFPRT